MRHYIYKIIIAIIAIIIAFEFTIGKEIDKLNNKINTFNTVEGRKQLVNSLKKKLKKQMRKKIILMKKKEF